MSGRRLDALSPEELALRRKLARGELLRRGDIGHLLDANQLADRENIFSRPTEDYVLDVSRQVGKSWLLVALALEQAFKLPGSIVKYASLTQLSVESIVEPILLQMLEDCPDDIRPHYDGQSKVLAFKNGSIIGFAGTDGKTYRRLRGPRAHLIIKDEAGFFDEPEEVDAVLSPQRMTTGGIIIEASTPPVTPGHPFTARAMAMKAQGRYSHRTIWEHARMTREQIVAFLKKEASMRGLSLEEFQKTTTYRREFMAEHVVDESRAVVPEWGERADGLVREVVRPRWFHHYEGFDIGWRDGSGVLFGYWHFTDACLVIEDEILLFGATTPTIAAAIKAKERALWPKTMDKPFVEVAVTRWDAWEPFKRVADNDLLVINDLAKHDALEFTPTAKDDKELQVNELRRLVAGGKIAIHPRCKHLITQLATTIWNKQRTSYERTQDGHGDLVDALVYLVRNIARNMNPEPPFWGVDRATHHIPDVEPTTEEEELGAAFGD